MDEDVDFTENNDDFLDLTYDNEENNIENNVCIKTDKLRQEVIEYESKWKREEIKPVNCQSDSVIIQQLDIDHFIANNSSKLNIQNPNKIAPIIRIYGLNKESNSVLINAYGFLPYFYIEKPTNFMENDIRNLIDELENQLSNENKSISANISKFIIDYTYESKINIYGYHTKKPNGFIKITVALPKLIAACKRLLDKGIKLPGKYEHVHISTFESNIDFEVRFMVDINLNGCCWLEVPKNTYFIRNIESKQDGKASNCQLEIDVMYTDIIAYKPDEKWSEIASLRILSFDIECAGRAGIFPDAQHDPIIQISSTVQIQNENEPIIKTVFTLNTCAPIVGCTVISFKDERHLLQAWIQFLNIADPDVIIGYNIWNFDFPYIIDRLNVFKMESSMYFGRIISNKSSIHSTTFQNKAYGKKENKSINITGRIQIDILQVILREHKLRSYTLNSVSYHFLNEQKEDVHHSIISDLQNGNEQTRRRLAIYCLKDSLLPLRLCERLMILINYIEMARVTGVPVSYLLTRGQQIKVISQLLRKAKSGEYIIPNIKVNVGNEFEGATVLEPNKGYYNVPIATLDFNSLYPSIMIANNLCYTTLVNNPDFFKLTNDQIIKTPCGNNFVNKEVRRGILPSILEDLLNERKKTKEALKRETDLFKKKVLDGRQLALKISANSVYGFTGAQVGMLPCLEISSSVTAFGRQMIDSTKSYIESHFCTSNGYSFNSSVIYGDTDSVMIKFGNQSLEECMDLGREAASIISSKFINPIRLEFEKVYFPYLLINKKRYAGLLYTNPKSYDKMDCKGIETVRRDNCPLVANVIETCLKMILIERNPDKAINHAKTIIADLLCNRIDISQLVITKELTKNTNEYSAKIAHNELAERIKKRSPNNAPKLGDRVPYVIISGSKGDKAFEKAEDPIYVLDNNISIDTNYYLDNQLSNPLLRIFEPILGDRASSILLKGEHTLSRIKSTSSIGGLSKFATKRLTCIGCRTALSEEDKNDALCSSCQKSSPEYIAKETILMRCLEKKYSLLWTECQRCQGSLVNEVLCQSCDCPIFYQRKKIQKDLLNQDKLITRFGSVKW